ncbi:MAG: heat shock protein HtpX [Solirubrobacteraceae bacterium]|jgi:heat shock protein HtpX|nr:heat shock protein HtpX [Solirubrobacteraceae bacterium]MEA2354969.1 heat shock protein HtpX [Solirubrobacteraceae bacterium]
MTSKRSTFGQDTGLQARMLLTMFLLGLVYAVLIGVLFASGARGITLAVVAGGLFLFQFFAADKLGLRAMGAREVSAKEEPVLHATIERLCVQADLPKPRIAVVDTSMPNAFAMGRSQKTATVCATTGILALLTPAELEGVMAHELTHVINRDVVIMTIAAFFASIASMIVQFGFFFGGGGEDDDDSSSFFVVILVSVAVYAVSFVLMQALSRYREFAADRGAAVITGRPSALASALLKISGTMKRVPQQDLRAAPREMAAFYIFPPGVKSTISNIFATHPPLEQRLAALSRLEAQLQSGR